MDHVISVAVVLAIALLAVAAVVLRLRRRRSVLGELAQLPDRVTNPKLYTALKTIRAWELHAADGVRACTWAKESNGTRFRTENAIRLPIAGCGRQCTCRYQPITEGRQNQRRQMSNATGVLNMSDPKEANRRVSDGRRKGDRWRGDQR